MVKKETKGGERKLRQRKRKKRDQPVCVLVEGNWGDHLPPLAPPWPQPEAFGGSLGSWGKTSRAPITPEPSAGLFTLARLSDSFTDVTYRHTGTLSQRRSSRSGGGGGGGEQNGWGREEWGGQVNRTEDGEKEKWYKWWWNGASVEEQSERSVSLLWF